MSKDQPQLFATDEELAYAVQENLFALFRTMSQLSGGELVETENLSYHHAFPSNPMFKGVWQSHLAEAEVDSVIQQTIEWFKERKAPFLFWWTGPGTVPGNLGERLQAHGMLDMAEQMQSLAQGIKQTALGAPCMIADLQHMNEAAVTAVPANFTIQEVQDEAALLDFRRVFIESYQIPDWAGQAWVDATLSLGIGKTPWQMFVGYLDGEAVATNILFNGAGVASVYGVATHPSARNKGIGGAITLKPLLLARDMGYRYGVLFSSEMGVSVYQRLGFRLTPARINRYLWRNTND